MAFTFFVKQYGPEASGSAALLGELLKGASGANPVTMGLSALTSLAGMIQGAVNIDKGKSAAARNVRPVLDQSKPYEDMLSLYEQQAQYGYDPSTLKFVTEENQNALTSTLQSMLMAGASPNDVAGAYAGYSNQLQKIAADDSEKRWQKVNAIGLATDKLATAKQQEFLYNEDAPYKDAAQAAAAQQNQGMQQLWGGLSSLSGNLIKQTGANKNFTDAIKKQLEAILGKGAATAEADYQIKPDYSLLTDIAPQEGGAAQPATTAAATAGGGASQTGSEMLNQILQLLFKG